MQCPVIKLAQQLIKRQSLSPNDAGCQQLLIERLQLNNFHHIEPMLFADTENLWAYHGLDNGPTLLFAGHTDVVPAGDEKAWTIPPFSAELKDGFLYGRGAADMKGSLAAMIVAAERFISQYPNHRGRLAFLITSDEEAKATNGTVKVVETLKTRNEKIDYCIVGEPSSIVKIGDVVKNGRRGSITANLTIYGTQGHVAYPHLAENPIHRAIPLLQELTSTVWDQGNEFFPATSMQIANIHAGTGSNNVIPGELFIQFNFRFSSELTAEEIKQRVTQLIDSYQLRYHLDWVLSGNPFLTEPGPLVNIVKQAIQLHTGMTPKLSTDGGTSDGRFIALMGTQIIELGPINATIHKIDEHVKASDLQVLSKIYQSIMEQVLC